MDSKLYQRSFELLIIYALWIPAYNGFIFANQTIVNLITTVVLILFLLAFTQSKVKQIPVLLFLWFPFIIWQVLAYSLQMHAERFLCWSSCLLLLLIGCGINTGGYLRSRLFFYTGVIAIVGVWFQLLFPDLHALYIGRLFKKDLWLSISEAGYGISGFTSNIVITGTMIFYGFGSILYLFNSKFSSKKNIVIYMVYLLTIILTGKRSLMLAAILSTMIIKVIVDKINGKSITKSLIGFSLLSLLCIYLLFINVDFWENVPGVGRVIKTFQMYSAGSDIDSGRYNLWTRAISLYQENPLLGIGVGAYNDLSGFEESAHNAYLQVLCEQGIIGFILFVIPILYCLVLTIKKIKENKIENRDYLLFSLFIQLFFVIYSFFGNPTINQYGYMVYFFVISVLCNKKEYI